ncbi:MAG: D-glycero-beta-D-manno-heptose 1,7-bisphosphate 7-phosphatase [Limnohabitans sp.]|jgi:D-glycero-D-manno-heptose 1,7-bisphosphate phosphatase|uniref:D-glycero-beta-D-manno-heptose 1,7-bisphosphate 7-phosphatase n=1 Tax=Limnohabitans sp. TaxID=1907725 RepID=UPI0025CDCD94|nr:D-glycero-beta-D-manno-heptose 1,7-bisphosphate 7-phosphatase [Limnohabitans sp.]MCO4090265.1 D-glycero-beta-D-manno-heptose 1,7-bisphosphate 7-phosphatase [Limnohabitans sp.]
MPHKLVILDCDGTLNQLSDEFVKSPEKWHPLPGALEAIGRLNHAGFHVVLATNQSGIGRGVFDMGVLNAMHAHMLKSLAAVGGRIDAIFYCPHAPDETCVCRKPAPGLLQQIAERYGVPTLGVPYVGDSLHDMQAAHAAACSPHLVLTGRHADLAGQPLPAEFPSTTQVHADLAAFVDCLLGGVATSGIPA